MLGILEKQSIYIRKIGHFLFQQPAMLPDGVHGRRTKLHTAST